MRRFALLIAVLVLGLNAMPARAATLYDFTWTETRQFGLVSAGSMAGTLTVDAGIITAITGSGTLGTITALLPPGSFINDNTFPLNLDGVSFIIAGVGYNLFSVFSGTAHNLISDGGSVESDVAFSTSVANVPESMSLALLGFGLAGLALARRARV